MPSCLIAGAGALGSLYGSLLQRAGWSVSVVSRRPEVYRGKSIKIESHWGQWNFEPESSLAYSESQEKPFDYVLIAAKVQPEIDWKAMLKAYVGAETTLVLIQNGIFIEETVCEFFPENTLLSCLAFVCAWRENPLHIKHIDYGKLTLGEWGQSDLSESAKAMVTAWESQELEIEVLANVQKGRWQKLVWNAPFNPLSVICQANTEDLLSNDLMRSEVEAIMQEVMLLAEADGHSLHPKTAEKMIAYTQTMEPYKTSMLRDFEAGRPLETEAILGKALRFAKNKDINLPRLNLMYAMLQRLGK